ncbi:MAG: type II toxin-antitoxin system VapC family toxin [Pontiella sp.]
MKLLLDTHAFLWALMETEKINRDVVHAIMDSDNEVFISSITLLEIGLKHGLGKLELNGITPSELPEIASRKMGFHLVDLDSETAATIGDLPKIHNDPFDCMLIHQAIRNEFVMVSANKQFPSYQFLRVETSLVNKCAS